MNAIANLTNWHRYLIGFLVGLDAVCVAIASGAVVVPEGLKEVTPWAALLNIFIVALLPRFQLPTGPGAEPILSPPPKDIPVAAVPLVPAFKVPPGTFERGSDRPPGPPMGINIQPSPFSTTGNAGGTVKLEDGHELPPFQKPPARPLP